MANTPYQQIKQLLDDNAVLYKEIDHEPVFTSEQAAKVRGLSLGEGAKSLLLKANDNFILVVLPGNEKLDSKKLKRLTGFKNIRFASPEEVESTMYCKVGSCYPFGNLINLRTIVDRSMTLLDSISFNPGVHDKSIKIKLTDYLVLVKPEIADVVVE